MNDQNNEERLFQCEFDVENVGEGGGREGVYSAPFVCAVCGAGARVSTNLCEPESNRRLGRGRP